MQMIFPSEPPSDLLHGRHQPTLYQPATHKAWSSFRHTSASGAPHDDGHATDALETVYHAALQRPHQATGTSSDQSAMKCARPSMWQDLSPEEQEAQGMDLLGLEDLHTPTGTQGDRDTGRQSYRLTDSPQKALWLGENPFQQEELPEQAMPDWDVQPEQTDDVMCIDGAQHGEAARSPLHVQLPDQALQLEDDLPHVDHNSLPEKAMQQAMEQLLSLAEQLQHGLPKQATQLPMDLPNQANQLAMDLHEEAGQAGADLPKEAAPQERGLPDEACEVEHEVPEEATPPCSTPALPAVNRLLRQTSPRPVKVSLLLLLLLFLLFFLLLFLLLLPH